MSAILLAFPIRVPAAPETALRLQAALTALQEALAAQREAVAAWRGALAELHDGLTGLATSMQSCDAALDSLAQDVAGLNRQARRLMAI